MRKGYRWRNIPRFPFTLPSSLLYSPSTFTPFTVRPLGVRLAYLVFARTTVYIPCYHLLHTHVYHVHHVRHASSASARSLLSGFPATFPPSISLEPLLLPSTFPKTWRALSLWGLQTIKNQHFMASSLSTKPASTAIIPPLPSSLPSRSTISTATMKADPMFEDLWRPSPVHSPTGSLSPLASPGIKTPHPLEESLLPLSPDELRRQLALPENLGRKNKDAYGDGQIFSAPLPLHSVPTSPAAGYFTFPASNSPEQGIGLAQRIKDTHHRPKRSQSSMATPSGINGTERAKVS